MTNVSNACAASTRMTVYSITSTAGCSKGNGSFWRWWWQRV